MEYPLISEYKEAILSAEDNFNELSSLRPVLDSHGDPVMSSGNFAVVFKMREESDGKLYAVKCFIKDQEGRDESYRKIADELEVISSSYILPLRYLENELFVDSAQCDREEFPVVVMEWVEGETLDAYLNRNLNDKYELEMLSYRFNRMAAWLLAQPFAHGDLKPDNILVRKDGSLVLVDYDGMFVPSMKGEKAREIGSPDYRHPSRTVAYFDEHIDDFSIAVIALSLKAIELNPELKTSSSDSLLLNEKDYQSPSNSVSLKEIQKHTSDSGLSLLLGIFYIALAKNSLDSVSFRLFMIDKPKSQKKTKVGIDLQNEKIDTSSSCSNIDEGIEDEFGVVYSKDGKRLLAAHSDLIEYNIKSGTLEISDYAFYGCESLESVTVPNTVIKIGHEAFSFCNSLKRITISKYVTTIGHNAFCKCLSLKNITLPNSVTVIKEGTFRGCTSLLNISIPPSVTRIEDYAFAGCKSLQSVFIPNSITYIGKGTFSRCACLRSILIPNSVSNLGSSAFRKCSSLKNVSISKSITEIKESTFSVCSSLINISIPDNVISIKSGAFSDCISLQLVSIPGSIKSITTGAFANCPNLRINLSHTSRFKNINGFLIDRSGTLVSCLNYPQSISIPHGVTTIGHLAFWGCKSLKNVLLPKSITTIEVGAFSSCTSLLCITIPASVTTIEGGAFSNCPKLTLNLSTNHHFKLNNGFLIDKSGRLGSCLNNSPFISIPESVQIIESSAFLCCTSLESISIPKSVKIIETLAFSGCTSLRKITIPETVTYIGNQDFPKGCEVIRTK